jgi:hypothetical protein
MKNNDFFQRRLAEIIKVPALTANLWKRESLTKT